MQYFPGFWLARSHPYLHQPSYILMISVAPTPLQIPPWAPTKAQAPASTTCSATRVVESSGMVYTAAAPTAATTAPSAEMEPGALRS
jgi:hypothetical protein